MKKKILISGAGIAGPTLAFWLHKNGHDVTVIEKAKSLRLGGQNIDISDSAIDIVKMMDIESEIKNHNTTEIGLKFVNEKNQTQALFPKGKPLSFTSKYEILRGDLAEILIDLTKSKIPYMFGKTIERLVEKDDKVFVEFNSGESEAFDLAVAADGVSSTTRKLIVGDTDPFKYLGVFTSYATLPKRSTDEKWARWYNTPEGRVILMRPDNKGTTRASVNFWWDHPEIKHYSNDEAVSKIREILKGAGWEADRIATDIANDPDIYLGPVSQVRLSTWSKGRCVLVGDSAYCPTPFTGMGTTLAIIGAYILAGEISKHDDHAQAFSEYETKFRGFVEEIQKVIPGQFRLVYPKSKVGVRILNKTVAIFASNMVQGLMKKLNKKPKEMERRFKLPTY